MIVIYELKGAVTVAASGEVRTKGLAFEWAQEQAHKRGLDPAIVWIEHANRLWVGMTDRNRERTNKGEFANQWFVFTEEEQQQC